MLRFGGNAVDRRFFWTSSNEAVPSTATRGDKAHPVRAVGPADLARLNTLLEAADATVSLTVDLGHYDPDRAADMAKHAAEIFGPRLLSFTVGNEPNGFGANGVRPGGYSIGQVRRGTQGLRERDQRGGPQRADLGPGRLRPEMVAAVHRCRHPAEEDPVVPQLPAPQLRRKRSQEFADHRRT